MPIFAWIVLGLIAGFLGSKVVKRHGKGIFLDVVLGIVGAVAGGYLFTFFVHAPTTGLDWYSVLVATAGAVLVLVLNYGLRRGLADRLT
ncbi:MAG: GlsB/YeaQ/YmgE family stress response membrane protein [Bryobacteraceae bacterium]